MDPYQTLGIDRDATQREVQRAYRRLAMEFHPDHNSGDPEAEERFKWIQEAYRILTGRRSPGMKSPEAPVSRYGEHPFFAFFNAMKGE